MKNKICKSQCLEPMFHKLYMCRISLVNYYLNLNVFFSDNHFKNRCKKKIADTFLYGKNLTINILCTYLMWCRVGNLLDFIAINTY